MSFYIISTYFGWAFWVIIFLKCKVIHIEIIRCAKYLSFGSSPYILLKSPTDFFPKCSHMITLSLFFTVGTIHALLQFFMVFSATTRYSSSLLEVKHYRPTRLLFVNPSNSFFSLNDVHATFLEYVYMWYTRWDSDLIWQVHCSWKI